MARLFRNTKQHHITAGGVIRLREQLAALKQERAHVVEEMRDLTSQSGASSTLEDSLHALHRDRAIELNEHIHQIEHILSTAAVISQPASHSEVQLGSQVTLDVAGAERTYMIVGSLEADPDQGKISNESPLGRCLLGKKVNDHLEVVRLTGSRLAGRIIAIR